MSGDAAGYGSIRDDSGRWLIGFGVNIDNCFDIAAESSGHFIMVLLWPGMRVT